MKLQQLFLQIAILILAVLLCACAGDKGDSESAPQLPTAASEAEPPVVPGEPDAPPEVLEEAAAGEQPEADDPMPLPEDAAGQVVISFEYVKQSGAASNQFAVWIENLEGQLIKTLYATAYTAQGGYKNRPDSLALWVEKSGLASLSKGEVDAVSGATPKAGALSYTWDLTDINGSLVEHDDYRFCIEGTLRWKNYVLYSGYIRVGDRPNTGYADPEYFYEAAGNNPALTDASPENSMIGSATAEFIPSWGL